MFKDDFSCFINDVLTLTNRNAKLLCKWLKKYSINKAAAQYLAVPVRFCPASLKVYIFINDFVDMLFRIICHYSTYENSPGFSGG